MVHLLTHTDLEPQIFRVRLEDRIVATCYYLGA